MSYRNDVAPPVRLAMKIGPWAALGLFLLILTSCSYYSIDAGERGVVTQFGAVQTTVGPGLHFKLPIVQGVETISTRTAALEWSGESSMQTYSKDQQVAVLAVKVTWRVIDDPRSVITVFSQYKNTSGLQSSIIVPRAAEAIKTVFGQFNAVTAVQERARLNVETEKAVIASMAQTPVFIEAVQITNIDFSDAYEQSIEKRMEAQVEVERIAQNLERERKQAEIKVVQAQADADALLAQATAESQAIKLRGDAEASSIRARNAALADSPKLVELTAVEKWDGVLPTTMPPNGTVPFLPVK